MYNQRGTRVATGSLATDLSPNTVLLFPVNLALDLLSAILLVGKRLCHCLSLGMEGRGERGGGRGEGRGERRGGEGRGEGKGGEGGGEGKG